MEDNSDNKIQELYKKMDVKNDELNKLQEEKNALQDEFD
jgi:hypothetical protein